MVVVKEAFDDVALLIGSVAAARKLPDDLVQTLISRLDRLRVQTLRRLSSNQAHSNGENKAELPRVHPAIEEFLFRDDVTVTG